MTLGQLVECVTGKMCCHFGCFNDATPFTKTNPKMCMILSKNTVDMLAMVMKYYMEVLMENNYLPRFLLALLSKAQTHG